MKKKIIAFALSALMVTSLLPANVFADEAQNTELLQNNAGETAGNAASPESAQSDNICDNGTAADIVLPLSQLTDSAAGDDAAYFEYASMAADAYNEQNDGMLSLMTVGGDTLVGGEIISEGGTYYITSETTGTVTIATDDEVVLEGVNLYVQSDSATQIRAARNLSIAYTCERANLTLNNAAIIEPDADKSVIKFIGEDNLMKLAGVNLLELDTGAGYKALVHIIDDEDEDGLTDSLTVQSADMQNPGTLYAYKRGAGAGFGSDGGETSACNGKITFGADSGDKMRIFGKTSKMGAFIGNGAYCPEYPNDIVFNGGIYYLESNARGSIIGGAAGETASEAGAVLMRGGTFNLNVDYSGAAVGSGGDAGINSRFGGYLLLGSASVRTFINHNAGSQWSSFGASDAGVNDACITAKKKVMGEEGMSFDDMEALEDVYMLKFDTSIVTAPQNPGSNCVYNILCDEDPDFLYSGDGYEYYYINESLYKQEQIAIETTYQNWNEMDDMPENKRDTNLYFYMRGQDVTLTVNDEETFEYEFVPEYDTSQNIVGGSFRLVRAANSVSGGDVISAPGTYVVTDTNPGTLTISTTDEVRLMTSGEVSGVTIAASPGTVTDIILDGVEMTNDSGSVFALNGGGLEITGHNILKGEASSSGCPTLSVTGNLSIAGDTLDDKLDISAGDANAAIDISIGGSYTQNGGTVMAVKTGGMSGSEAAAISADGADFLVNDGQFYGTTNTSGIPVIYAGAFGASTEGTITAQAYANTYAVCAGEWNVTLGSIKLTGNNGAVLNASAAYDTDDMATLANLGTFEAYACDVSNLQASGGSGVYTCWADDNTNPNNRIYYGTGHRYSSAENGTTFVEYDNDELNDPCIYFWFPSDASVTHVLYINDDTMGRIYWTSEGWSIDAPVYNIMISTPQTGFFRNECPLGGSLTPSAIADIMAGTDVTGTYAANAGYGLREIRYFYYIGHTQKNYTITVTESSENPGTGTFSFKMPGAPIRLEAIWGESHEITVTNAAVDAVITGIQTGQTALENASFTVACADPCVVLVCTGSSVTRVSGRPSLSEESTYAYSVNASELSGVIVAKRGDVNSDGIVSLQDISGIMLHLKAGAVLNPIAVITADTNNDGLLTVRDADRCLKSLYNIETPAW